jgi:hypothetical protein
MNTAFLRARSIVGLAVLSAVVALCSATHGQDRPVDTSKARQATRPPKMTRLGIPAAPAPGPDGVSTTRIESPSDDQPGKLEFSDQFLRIEEIGLSVRLPIGCDSEKVSIGNQRATAIFPEDQSWRVNLETPRSTNSRTTITEVADKVLDELQKSVGIVVGALRNTPEAELRNPKSKFAGTRATLIDRFPNAKTPKLFIGDGESRIPIERFYLAIPRGEKDSPLVRGYTVAQVAPQQFVAFDLTTTEKDFDRVRPIYEAMIATARLGAPEDVTAARGVAIEAGHSLIKSLTSEDYKAVLEKGERWIRMYKPAAGGARADADEIGYTRIKTSVGQRGQIDRTRTKSRWNQADRQEGYLVEIDARYIYSGLIIDSAAAYFMTPDRNEEAWTVRQATREWKKEDAVVVKPDSKKPKPALVASEGTEIGARSGQSMTITATATGKPDSSIKPTIQSDAYISVVEALLMPQIAVRSKQAVEFGFYAWQGRDGKIRLRRDSVEQPSDKPGVWQVTTRIGDDDRVQIALYNEKGDLIRTVMPDGVVCEPISLDELGKLWKSKNLPMSTNR